MLAFERSGQVVQTPFSGVATRWRSPSAKPLRLCSRALKQDSQQSGPVRKIDGMISFWRRFKANLQGPTAAGLDVDAEADG